MPSAEEYDGMVQVDDQSGVCIEQLQYLQQLVAAVGQSTTTTDAAIAQLQEAQSHLRQYMQDSYPDGRPDENAETPEQESGESDDDNPYS